MNKDTKDFYTEPTTAIIKKCNLTKNLFIEYFFNFDTDKTVIDGKIPQDSGCAYVRVGLSHRNGTQYLTDWECGEISPNILEDIAEFKKTIKSYP